MFGEGISITDLIQLLNCIRAKELTLQVKIIDEPWEDLSQNAIAAMIQSIMGGKVTQSNDIRLRLFSKVK